MTTTNPTDRLRARIERMIATIDKALAKAAMIEQAEDEDQDESEPWTLPENWWRG